MNESLPVCKVCDKGNLIRTKKYRMSGPAVVIGYILLIPSIFGILIGLLMFLGTGAATSSSSDSMKKTITAELQKANIPSNIIEKVVNHGNIEPQDRKGLSYEQTQKLDNATMTYNIGKIGTGAGAVFLGGLAIFFIVMSFIGGLLGWLLVMKKKVLQCSVCSAVVNAS